MQLKQNCQTNRFLCKNAVAFAGISDSSDNLVERVTEQLEDVSHAPDRLAARKKLRLPKLRP